MATFFKRCGLRLSQFVRFSNWSRVSVVVSPTVPLTALSQSSASSSQSNNDGNTVLREWLNEIGMDNIFDSLVEECAISHPRDFQYLTGSDYDEMCKIMGLIFAQKNRFIHLASNYTAPRDAVQHVEDEENDKKLSEDDDDDVISSNPITPNPFNVPLPSSPVAINETTTKKTKRRRASFTLIDKYEFCRLKEIKNWTIRQTCESPQFSHRKVPPNTAKKWANNAQGIDSAHWASKINANSTSKKKIHPGRQVKYPEVEKAVWEEYKIRDKYENLDVSRLWVLHRAAEMYDELQVFGKIEVIGWHPESYWTRKRKLEWKRNEKRKEKAIDEARERGEIKEFAASMSWFYGLLGRNGKEMGYVHTTKDMKESEWRRIKYEIFVPRELRFFQCLNNKYLFDKMGYLDRRLIWNTDEVPVQLTRRRKQIKTKKNKQKKWHFGNKEVAELLGKSFDCLPSINYLNEKRDDGNEKNTENASGVNEERAPINAPTTRPLDKRICTIAPLVHANGFGDGSGDCPHYLAKCLVILPGSVGKDEAAFYRTKYPYLVAHSNKKAWIDQYIWNDWGGVRIPNIIKRARVQYGFHKKHPMFFYIDNQTNHNSEAANNSVAPRLRDRNIHQRFYESKTSDRCQPVDQNIGCSVQQKTTKNCWYELNKKWKKKQSGQEMEKLKLKDLRKLTMKCVSKAWRDVVHKEREMMQRAFDAAGICNLPYYVRGEYEGYDEEKVNGHIEGNGDTDNEDEDDDIDRNHNRNHIRVPMVHVDRPKMKKSITDYFKM